MGFFQWIFDLISSKIIDDTVVFDLLHKSIQQKIWFIFNSNLNLHLNWFDLQ